jgi:hypothetical protein
MLEKKLVSLTFSIIFVAGAQTCNNQTVIDAVKRKLTPNMIVKAISVQKCNFDVTFAGLADLKGAGVPDEVISAMQATIPSSSNIAPPQNLQPMQADVGDVFLMIPGSEPRRLTRISLPPIDMGRVFGNTLKMAGTLGMKGVFTKNTDNIYIPGESSDVKVPASSGLRLVVPPIKDRTVITLFRVLKARKGKRTVFKVKGRVGSIEEIVGDKVPIEIVEDKMVMTVTPQHTLGNGKYALVMDRMLQLMWTFDIE